MLCIKIRGEVFKVNNDGEMTQYENSNFSGEWKFLGVSFHHWRKWVDIPFSPERDPKEYLKGLLWDYDHGTVRQWRGSYMGYLPRIVSAWKE